MINNKVEYIKEEEIYKEINILIKAHDTDEYMYIDGSKIDEVRVFLKAFGFDGTYEIDTFLYPAVIDYMQDIFNFKIKSTRIVIIISNIDKMLSNLKYTGFAKDNLEYLLKNLCHYFEDGVTCFYGGSKSRKSLDIYLSEDDVDFEKLDERILEREENEWIEDRINVYKGVTHPIGTVVRLRDENKRFKLSEFMYMITDRFIIENVGDKEYYEYKANVYPIGTHPTQKGILFNNEQIGQVEYAGYDTVIDKRVVKQTKEELEKLGITKKEIK